MDETVKKNLGIEDVTRCWPARLGRVSSKGYLYSFGHPDHTRRAHFDVNKLVTLPQFEIFVDVACELPINAYLKSATSTATADLLAAQNLTSV
jgi:hypothetical protein